MFLTVVEKVSTRAGVKGDLGEGKTMFNGPKKKKIHDCLDHIIVTKH